MTFQEKHPETGAMIWGCPRYSFHATAWLIDWINPDGSVEGSSIAKGVELEWIKANPVEVDKMIELCANWKGRLGLIPY